MSKLTEIIVLLDRSGSMANIREDMLGGLNSFIEAQKKLEGACKISFITFDDKYDVVWEGRDIKEVRPLTNEDFVPRGWTALLDAIGKTIVTQGERFASASRKPSSVIMVIITDGMENKSTEYTRDQVMKLVKRQEDEWKWQFTYLGANQDAIAEGQKFGMFQRNSLTYSPTKGGIIGAFNSLTANVGSSRMTGGPISYSIEERLSSVTSDKK